jgi:hypothetical protein
MAAKPRPSFLKRQKEMKRKEKAAAKVAMREQKKQAKQEGNDRPSMMATLNEFGEIVEMDDEEADRLDDRA